MQAACSEVAVVSLQDRNPNLQTVEGEERSPWGRQLRSQAKFPLIIWPPFPASCSSSTFLFAPMLSPVVGNKALCTYFKLLLHSLSHRDDHLGWCALVGRIQIMMVNEWLNLAWCTKGPLASAAVFQTDVQRLGPHVSSWRRWSVLHWDKNHLVTFRKWLLMPSFTCDANIGLLDEGRVCDSTQLYIKPKGFLMGLDRMGRAVTWPRCLRTLDTGEQAETIQPEIRADTDLSWLAIMSQHLSVIIHVFFHKLLFLVE